MNNSMILDIKIFLGTLLSFLLLFLVWKESYSAHCVSLVLPMVMLLIVCYGYVELKMKERSCFKKCYFQNDTLASKMLSSRTFVVLFYIVTSIAMTISAFVVSLGFPTILWLYFIFHIVLSLFLFKYLKNLFSKVFQKDYQILFAREWTIRIMAVVLMAVFVYISLNEYTPEYLSASLQQTTDNAIRTVSSRCDIISTTLKYEKMLDSSFWWIVSEGTEQMNNTMEKSGIWLAFLFYNSLALLGINRLVIQILYLLSERFGNKVRKNERE